MGVSDPAYQSLIMGNPSTRTPGTSLAFISILVNTKLEGNYLEASVITSVNLVQAPHHGA